MSEVDRENLRIFNNAFRAQLGLKPINVNSDGTESRPGLGQERPHLNRGAWRARLVARKKTRP